MQKRFDTRQTQVPPLRAEPRSLGVASVDGVNVTSGGLIRATIGSGLVATAILTFFTCPQNTATTRLASAAYWA
jgi:hypothetical protein